MAACYRKSYVNVVNNLLRCTIYTFDNSGDTHGLNRDNLDENAMHE